MKKSLGINPFFANIFALCAGAFAVGCISVALLGESGLQPDTGVLGLVLGLAFMCIRYRALRKVCAGLKGCFHEDWLRRNMAPGNRSRWSDKDRHQPVEFDITGAEEPPRSLWN